MERSRRKEIERHLSEDEIDELLRDARDDHRLRRLGFLKNLYRGDSIPEAAEREGRSAATGDRWAEAWNEGGLGELMPDFGGGRPPKLDEQQQEELVEMLRDDQPWKSQEIHRLLQEEFGVEYSPNYLSTFLRGLGLSHVTPRSKRSSRRESTDDGGWIVDDNVGTDGGTVGGVCETSKPDPHR